MRVVALSNLEQFAAVNLNSDPGRIPGPKVIPGAAMVRLNWTMADGKVGHNIMYASYNGTPALSQSLANSVHATLIGATWTAFALYLHPSFALSGVTLLDVRDAVHTEINSSSAAVPGTSTGTPLPDEAALVLTLKTAVRGPSGRGRIYLPGFASNGLVSGGIVVAGLVTAASAWGNTAVSGAVGLVGPLSLGLPARAGYTSPLTGRVFPARAATTVPVTQVLCRDNHWDTQRRRGLK